MSYAGHQLEGSYPSAEMQSVYSAAPSAEWDSGLFNAKAFLVEEQ